ncbi:MAG: SurA N-terminal domain-containing protein [Burkholderiaceae bacterium]
MFDSIRKNQRLFLALILLLILPAFVLFGVSGYESFVGDGDQVASVDGRKITRQEFEVAQRRQLENLRQTLRGDIDPALLDTPQARREVVEGLIAQRVLLNQAIANHMQINDDMLRAAILEIPGLRKDDGSFDADNYRMLVASQGMTHAGFEAQLRRDLAIQALPESIVASGWTPKSVVEQVLRVQGESRDVRELLIKPDAFTAKVTPTDEQLKVFYDNHAGSFETPESIKVQYVMLDPLALAAQVPLDDEKIRTFYEQNKARYSVAERRQASHILIEVPKDADAAARDKARARADELLAKLKGGADFAALAKQASQDTMTAPQGGDLGLFTPEMMVKPVADAAFSLKAGEISGVVTSEFGFHLIKLAKIEPGSVKPFEAVRAEIEAEYRRGEAAKLFAKDAEEFTNLVYDQPDSLQPAADRFKLKIETVDRVLRAGVEGGAPNAPLANPKLLAALFNDEALNKRRNTQAIEVSSQALVSARVVEHAPAKRIPFDEVRAQIRQRVIAEEAHKLAVADGQARLKAVQDGGKVDDFSAARTVRRGQDAGIPLPALEPIFRAPADKLPRIVGVDLSGAGYALYQVVKVTPPEQKEIDAQRDVYQRQLAQLTSQAELTDFIDGLKARSKVKRNPAALRSESDRAD